MRIVLGVRPHRLLGGRLSLSVQAGKRFVLGACITCAGCAVPPPGNGPDPTDPAEPVWLSAFDVEGVGVLSSVWGSSPSDIFVVGGTTPQGEIYHYDGREWRSQVSPAVPLLVWVFGFGPDDVYVVGEAGGAAHFDGTTWTALSTGTTEDLWGIWGASPDDLWIVGGDVGAGDPLILHYDGTTFTPVDVPPNDRSATSLFKVWGIGSKVFAVGENGLILQLLNGEWAQVPAGAAADDDFVALWGTSENNIVAVGGRGTARIARYDGTSWSTQRFTGKPGLNAIYMVEGDEAIVGGTNGYVGRFDTTTAVLTDESSGTNQCVHGMWGDAQGVFYAVGGTFAAPFSGISLQRRLGDPSMDPGPTPPLIRSCMVDVDCRATEQCVAGVCVSTAECGSDGDCATGESCVAGVCVAPTLCIGDQDCDMNQTCNAGSCVDISPLVCSSQHDCALGDNCEGGACISAGGLDIEYREGVGALSTLVPEGGTVTVFRGFQGGIHIFATLRASGLPASLDVMVQIAITLVGNGTAVASARTERIVFVDVEGGFTEGQNIFIGFDQAGPGDLDGKEARIDFTVTDPSDQTRTVTLSQRILLVEPDAQ